MSDYFSSDFASSRSLNDQIHHRKARWKEENPSATEAETASANKLFDHVYYKALQTQIHNAKSHAALQRVCIELLDLYWSSK